MLIELGAEAIIAEDGFDSVNVFAKTIWAAYHRQKITRGQPGDVTGYSFLVGAASAFAYTTYETDEFTDWLAAVHVLGPSVELTFFHQDGYVRFGMDIFGDFAMVRSFAFEKYKENRALDGVKTILKKEDYYYAFHYRTLFCCLHDDMESHRNH